MSDRAVAFAFSSVQSGADVQALLPETLQKQTGETAGIIVYTSGEECRSQVRFWPSSVSVIVNNQGKGITPINLAAALCVDNPERDVYLMEDKPTELLACHARVAGIRGIVNLSQAKHLLAMCKENAAESYLAGEVDLSLVGEVDLSLVGQVDTLYFEKEHVILPKAAKEYVAPVVPVAPEVQVVRQEAQNLGRVIGFFSGRGGVGKSTVALMTALSAQQRGLNTALIDLDLQFGDIAFLAGKEPSSRIQRMTLAQVCHGGVLPKLSDETLTLVSAPEQPEQGERYSSVLVKLLDDLAAQKELVVINTGSFWTDIHAKTITRCTQIALLMDQRATSIEACKRVIDLCFKLQVPRASFLYVLNGCGRGAAFTPQDASLALGGFEVYGIADGGALVDELLSLGCPMELLNSGNAFVASLESMLDTLVGRASSSVEQDALDHSLLQKAKLFDIDALRRFFEGRRRVVT